MGCEEDTCPAKTSGSKAVGVKNSLASCVGCEEDPCPAKTSGSDAVKIEDFKIKGTNYDFSQELIWMNTLKRLNIQKEIMTFDQYVLLLMAVATSQITFTHKIRCQG